MQKAFHLENMGNKKAPLLRGLFQYIILSNNYWWNSTRRLATRPSSVELSAIG